MPSKQAISPRPLDVDNLAIICDPASEEVALGLTALLIVKAVEAMEAGLHKH